MDRSGWQRLRDKRFHGPNRRPEQKELLMNKMITSLVSGIAFAAAPFAALAEDAAPQPAPQASVGPLAPAGAAGVEQAQSMDETPWVLIGGGALVIAGAALALSSGGDNDNSSTSTTTPF
jgi:hypothetical protein